MSIKYLITAVFFIYGTAVIAQEGTTSLEPNSALAKILAKNAKRYDENGNRKLDKFATVQEMIADYNDFHPENNSYELISEKPLHIRLSAVVSKDAHPESVQADLKRAMIYGIYKSFIHTDINEITVTVNPVVIQSWNPYRAELRSTQSTTLKKNRQQALADVQHFLPVANLTELLGGKELTWTKEFNQLQFTDQGGVGLNNFYSYITHSDSRQGNADKLMESSGLAWQQAEYLDKLAVCTVAVTALYEDGSFVPAIMRRAVRDNGIHQLSTELLIELDKAFKPMANERINQSRYADEVVIHKIADILENGWVNFK